MTDVFVELLRLQEAGQPGVLVVVVEAVGSTPAKPGARMVVRGDATTFGTVGGGALEHHATELAPEVLAAGQPRLVPLDLGADLGMSCGGRATLYLEPFGLTSGLYVFGAGHISVELCEMAARCGFSVCVCDERDSLRTAERFPRASRLVASLEPATLAELGLKDRADQAYVVVVTHTHELDFSLVETILPWSPAYLGMIGSKRKRRALEERLAAAGVAAEQVAAVRCPAGLALGGASPAEIALSITAELVAVRGQTDG